MSDWYVLHVKTGNELNVVNWIKILYPDIRMLTPQRILKERHEGKWKLVTRTLFPGYVFILVHLSVDMYYYLNSVPNVIKILGDNKIPKPVPEEEMQLVLKLSWRDDPLEISNVILEGSEVNVVSGPLEGFIGKIEKIDPRRFRAKVKIELMGEERIVELGINIVEKVD